MKRVLAAALLVSLVAGSAHAEDPLGREGTYIGSGEGELTVKLKHLENDIYGVSISTLVPMEGDIPGCGGGIDGQMLLTADGGNFFVENADYDPNSASPVNAPVCEIQLRWDEDGVLNLDEREGCMYYHGAACGFSGQLINRDAAG